MNDIHPLETWPDINDCPFCNAEARNFELNFKSPFNPKLNWINCMDCGAQSPIGDTPEEAIEKWNEPLDIQSEYRTLNRKLELREKGYLAELKDYAEDIKKLRDALEYIRLSIDPQYGCDDANIIRKLREIGVIR